MNDAATVSVIPVPRHMTPADAWAEILIHGRLVEYRWWRLRYRRCRWAVIRVPAGADELTEFEVVNHPSLGR